MRLGQIHHIDIVADTGAVRRVVIVAEDPQFRSQACSRLRHKGQQILRYAVGQLAYFRRRMGADGIEIPQDGSVQILVRMGFVANDFLIDLLGIAVGRQSRLNRSVLIYRQMRFVRLTVHGAGRREDEILHPMQFHHFQQRNQAADIVAIVEQRFLHRLAYRLACRKMDDTDNIRKCLEHIVQIHKIAAIDIGELRFASHNCSNAVQHVNRRVAQIIHDCHVVALLHQFNRCMGTDITRSACN